MAKPRIFVSSTYEDLKDIRSEISDFIESQGYEPVSFEMNDIPFCPTLSLEDSCYEEVKNCSMLILVIKDRFGSLSNSSLKGSSSYFSITRKEYITAKNLGLPIFVFVHSDTFNEYQIYRKQVDKSVFSFKYMESEGVARFIEEIYEESQFRFIHQFKTTKEIILTLRKQWAGLFNTYLKNDIHYKKRSNENIYINSFKLFFFRRSAGISQAKLAKRAKIKERMIQKIEDAGIKKSRINVEDFVAIKHEEAQRIATILKCTVGNIKAGLPDDFLSQNISYYFKNKGTLQREVKKSSQKNIFFTKVVLFDFDGTMTTRDDNLTSWERIWLRLGYEIKECGELHGKYSNFEITHKEWCKKTEKKFKDKGLKNTDLDWIASEITLVQGVEQVIRTLHANNIKMYILSGSIRYIIKKVLGDDLYELFEVVKANEINFENKGRIKNIVGTQFDFEGKATFIKHVIDDHDIHPMEAFYVGNSINDEWAHESGAQTLCVNPRMTNPYHPIQWMYCIQNMADFNQILKFMHFENKLN